MSGITEAAHRLSRQDALSLPTRRVLDDDLRYGDAKASDEDRLPSGSGVVLAVVLGLGVWVGIALIAWTWLA